MIAPEAIEDRLAAVRTRIEAAASRAGRTPGQIALVGASKRQPAENVAAAARAGLAHVGENYVQEAVGKRAEVKAMLEGSGIELRWHLIGRLQRNKARDAVRGFHCVETLDRANLGRDLDRRASEAGVRIDTLLQVNLSGEPQKGGIPPVDVAALLAAAASWDSLRVIGLMSVPAAAPNPEASRPAFATLRALRDELRGVPGGEDLHELSMGMSSDFEVAIEEGATIVRVGTAIFGPREG